MPTKSMKPKPRLYIDFDDTLVDSLSVVVKMLNKRYNKSFKSTDVKKWDFSDCYPIPRAESERLFAEDEFWDNLTIENSVINVLKKLKDYYDLYIVSKGTKENLAKKRTWINNNILTHDIPITYIPLPICVSKGEIDMGRYSVVIDDNEEYLNESNADVKILFTRHPNRDWNSHWYGLTTNKWEGECERFLILTAASWTGGLNNE